MANKVDIQINADVKGRESVDELGTQLSGTAEAAQALGDQASGAAGGLDAIAAGAGAAAGDARTLGNALDGAADDAQALQDHAQAGAAGMNNAGSAAAALASRARQLAQGLNAASQSEQNAGAHAQGAAAGMNSASGAAGALAARAGQLAQGLNAAGQSEQRAGADAQGAAAGMHSASNAAGRLADESGQVSDGMESVGDQLASAKEQLLAFVGIQGLAESVKSVAVLSDAWQNLLARLQLALGAQTDVNAAVEDVRAVALRTYSSLEATAELYGKLATAGKDLGVSQQQALKLTETINRAVQLSGASAQASEAAIQQLIQGLQGGALRGDEFNSVMEQSPRLAQALAAGLNVPIGTLRSLAEQGKLTASEVIRALTNQSETIEQEFGALPLTIGRAVQNLQTEWQKFVGTMDSSTGASAVAVAGIQSLTAHLDDLVRIAAASGAALTASYAVQAVNALRLAAAEMAATGGAAALLRINLDKLSRPVQIAIAVTGFEIGYQLGEMLRENSALARQLGVGVVGFFQLLLNDLRLLKEATSAVFTDDTVDAALERYKQRNIEIGDTLQAMFEDAKKAPGEIASAADKAAQSTASAGNAATEVAQKMAYAGAAGAASMGQIGAAAETGRAALEALAAQINSRPAADNGIAQIVANLTAAKLRADDVDKVLRQSLPEAIGKLSGAELVKFRSEFIAAMDAADIKGKELQTGLRLIAEQAAQSLGVDVPLATNKITREFESARGNLAVLIRSLPELKAAGVDTASVVAQAMAKMIDGAKSQAEIDALTRQVGVLRKELGDKLADGLLDQAKDKAQALKKAMEEATPGIQGVEEAMRKLGVVSDETLKKTAADKVDPRFQTPV